MVNSAVRKRIKEATCLEDLVRKRFSQSGWVNSVREPGLEEMKGMQGKVVRFLMANVNRWVATETILSNCDCTRDQLAQIKRDMRRRLGYTVETKLGYRGVVLSFRLSL